VLGVFFLLLFLLLPRHHPLPSFLLTDHPLEKELLAVPDAMTQEE